MPAFELLNTLQPAEWNILAEYISVDFSGATPLVRRLFGQIYGEWKIREGVLTIEGLPGKGELYAALWPKEEYKDQRLRRVWMELHQVVKSFVVFRARLNRHWLAEENDYLRHLLDRGAYKRFAKSFSQTLKKLDKEPASTSDLQLHIAELRRMENEYRIHTAAPEDTFEKVAEALDRHYLASKLESWASMYTREKRYPQRHTFQFEEDVKQILSDAPLVDWPEVAVWAKVAKLESPDVTPTDFQALSAHLAQHPNLLPLPKLRQIRGYQFNYLLRNVRTHDREDYRKMWELAKTMLEEGTLHVNGRLSAPFLRAAVQPACLAGEAAWAAKFLDDHGSQLVGPERSQILAIHNMMVSYALGDFKEVLRGSAILRRGNPRFEVLLRVLQLKTHYDMGNEEEFLRMVEAFRKLMKRKKGLGKRFANGYSAFGVFAEKLGRIRFLSIKMSSDFSEEIIASGTGEKLWLVEKLAGLEVS